MDMSGRTFTKNGTRCCAAVDCLMRIERNAFMCEVHLPWLPEANKEELRSTFNAWKQKKAPRSKYLAARIRAIIAVAELEHKTAPASLVRVLEKLDTGEWTFAI